MKVYMISVSDKDIDVLEQFLIEEPDTDGLEIEGYLERVKPIIERILDSQFVLDIIDTE